MATIKQGKHFKETTRYKLFGNTTNVSTSGGRRVAGSKRPTSAKRQHRNVTKRFAKRFR